MKAFQDDQNDGLISEINVTPLVDVMLILMIIFLITAPLLVKKLDVNLPNAQGSQQSKSVSKTISIKENGSLLLEGVLISKDNLEKQLKTFSQNDLIIKIAADKNCKYQDVASVLSMMSRNKITNVGFLTQN